jgi:hypothetical protein
MSSPGLNLGSQFANDPQAAYRLQLAAALARIKPSASWFDWIAILSVVNAAIAVSNGNISFMLGLGITDYLHIQAIVGNISSSMILIGTGLAAGFLWLMGRYTKMGQKWALIIGMAVYVADGAILLTFPIQPWLTIGFHVFVLFMLYRALPAINAFEAIQAEAQAHGVSLDQQPG